jgi:hypothetical protein
MLASQTQRARKDVTAWLVLDGEQQRIGIDRLTFTEDQVLGDWFPDNPAQSINCASALAVNERTDLSEVSKLELHGS